MARKQTAPAKSETLSIRLDPKTRFILEYLSRLKGQTITTVVERAVVQSASQEVLKYDNGPITWQNLWSISEGVRTLALASVQELFPSFEDERRLAFAQDHWPFFYHGRADTNFPHASQFDAVYIDVLWPRLDEFIRIHEESTDRTAAGKAMAEALSKAGLKAPEWPPKKKPATDQDEIPF